MYTALLTKGQGRNNVDQLLYLAMNMSDTWFCFQTINVTVSFATTATDNSLWCEWTLYIRPELSLAAYTEVLIVTKFGHELFHYIWTLQIWQGLKFGNLVSSLRLPNLPPFIYTVL